MVRIPIFSTTKTPGNTMHVKGFLHTLLSPVMPKKNLNSLTLLVSGLLNDKNLSVTGLGRSIHLPIQERSCIKRSDRFVGNKKVHNQLIEIYGAAVKLLINSQKRPKIIVDWTHIPNTSFNAIRAAVVTSGRAITLYEEVHPEKKLSDGKVEENFLMILSKLLPDSCCPIILTDAGFRNPWFKTVASLGWDYIGRIRGVQHYWDGKKWSKCKDLFPKATVAVNSIGKIDLCTRNPLTTHLFLIKEKSKKRVSRKKYTHYQGGRNRQNYSRAAKEPWLLASSLSGENGLKAHRVIKLYKMRMQIEESFRDLKCAQYGCGMENAYSRKLPRLRVLCMIAMWAMLIAWLAGCLAEQKGWRSHFQVNSTQIRTLSLFYLGCQVIRRNLIPPDFPLENILKIAWNYIA